MGLIQLGDSKPSLKPWYPNKAARGGGKRIAECREEGIKRKKKTGVMKRV